MWLHPSWVCERDAQGNVTIRERNKEVSLNTEHDWISLSEDELELFKGAYRDAFVAVWPKGREIGGRIGGVYHCPSDLVVHERELVL